MKRISFLCGCMMLATLCSYAGNDKNIVPAVLKSAVVYRTGAELNHTAKATLVQGNNDVIIEGISNSVDLSSLQFGSDGGVTVMSVEFSTNYLKPVVKSILVKRLEDSIEAGNKDLAKLRVLLKTDQDLLDLLNANKEIRGTQTGLSVAELIKMMDYYKGKTLEIQNEMALHAEREIRLTESINQLNKQLSEEENRNTRTTGRLMLQLFSATSGNYNFTISYITQTAHWNPYYDLRVESVNKPISLVYRAKMVQTTGIDWKQVKLSLSTSVPNQQGNAPELKSWFLGYATPLRSLANAVAFKERLAGLEMEDKVVTGYGTTTAKKELFYKDRAVPLSDYISVRDNELNVVFDIDLPYDVPSNGKEQSVVLKEYNVPASYKFYAVPKLDQEAYLLGDVADWEQLNLLPGEANIIFEGTYVGKSLIDPNNTLDTLTLTLGKDKRVVVKRENLVDLSSVKFLGSNKKQVFTYEITVKNNKREKISMLLKDQYPLSTNKEIEVELLESNGAEVNTDTGVLHWNMELAPGQSKKVRMSYSIKYPKDRVVNLN